MERDAVIRAGNHAISGLRLLSGLRLPQPPCGRMIDRYSLNAIGWWESTRAVYASDE